MRNDIDEIRDSMRRFLPFENTEFDNNNLRNVLIGDREYNDFLIFSTALVMQLDNRIRVELINRLCDNEAVNFDVQDHNGKNPKNRIVQIASIYLMTNMLIENVPIPYELREKMFLSTYGRTMYPLQSEHFDALCETSDYYYITLKKTVEHIFDIEDKPISKFSNQPYFFFLYGWYYKSMVKLPIDVYENDEEIDLFKKASVIHYYSWCSSNKFTGKKWDMFIRDNGFIELKKAECSAILFAIDHIIKFMEIIYSELTRVDGEGEQVQRNKIYNDTKYKLALSGQFLSYSLANIINNDNGCTFSEYWKLLEKSGEDLVVKCKRVMFGVAVFSDYYTRELNMCYNTDKEINNVNDHKNLYLLCGSSRLISAVDYILNGKRPIVGLFIEKQIVPITKNMAYNYTAWYEKERKARETNYRYEILLLKILSKTYYLSSKHSYKKLTFNEKIEIVRQEHKDNPCRFLPYDYMI